jgi:Family of unknown function (DUF6272)
MSELEVIMEYTGNVTFAKIDHMLDNLIEIPAFKQLRRNIQKKLYGIFVECIENIYKNTGNGKDYLKKDQKPPYIRMGKQNGKFFISSGNIIANRRIKSLKNRIDRINDLDHEGLKSAYAEILDKEILSLEEGAGLGLITIALRSGNKIKYNFTYLDDHHSYYEMKIDVPNVTSSLY